MILTRPALASGLTGSAQTRREMGIALATEELAELLQSLEDIREAISLFGSLNIVRKDSGFCVRARVWGRDLGFHDPFISPVMVEGQVVQNGQMLFKGRHLATDRGLYLY